MKNHFGPFISSPLQIAAKKFQGFLRTTASRLESSLISCGKRLATGAVALQRMIVKKAYPRGCERRRREQRAKALADQEAQPTLFTDLK